jgi:hypothetical protein
MKLVCTLALVAASIGMACNTPKGGAGNGSQAQSLEDTSEVHYLPQEGKFFIVCRTGRSHNGMMQALVTKPELNTVCEGPALVPGELENIPVANAVQPDITTCESLSAESRNIDVAFTPAFANDYRNLTPSVARQKLCVGAVNVINGLTKNAQMFGFLVGDALGAPVLVIVDLPTGAVSFDEANMMLTVPSKLDQTVLASIETELAVHNITFCGVAVQPPSTSNFGIPSQNPNLLVGKRIDGACWILGNMGKSCAKTCADAQMQYDVRTQSWGGAAGSDANCQKLASNWDLQWKGADSQCFMSGYAVGCHLYSTDGVRRCTAQPTTAEAANITVKRFCACR